MANFPEKITSQSIEPDSDFLATPRSLGTATKRYQYVRNQIQELYATDGQKMTFTFPASGVDMFGVWPSTAGTAGYALTTDGAGNWSWSAVAIGDNGADVKNTSVLCSVAANALTIALKTKAGADPSAGDFCTINFRNATLTTGTYASVVRNSALSMTISSGSTLGHASTIEYPIFVYALNNAGTIELAASTSLVDLTKLWNTTAEGGAGAADSVDVIYSTTARTGVALKLIAVLKSTQTTAGTWAAVPTQNSPNMSDYVPARNVIGDRNGTAVPAGMIGEVVNSTVTSGNTTSATLVDVTGTSLPLTKGTWEIKYSLSVQTIAGTAAAGNEATSYFQITDSANNLLAGTSRALKSVTISATTAAPELGCVSASKVVSINTDTTYKIRSKVSNAGGGTGGSSNWYNQTDFESVFYAVRIA